MLDSMVGTGGMPKEERADPVRKLAFYASLALVFFRFSLLHQIASHVIGINLYPLYLFGIPALLGMFLTGGLRRTFEGRPAYYWTAFAIWLVVVLPFSTWRGGSMPVVFDYLRTSLVMLFAIAGLALTWKECQLLLGTAALGAVVNLLTARVFDTTDSGGRLFLELGSIANSNDLAAHLMLVLPFLLWVALSVERAKILRLLALVAVACGLIIIIRTGSRGALIALSVDVVFTLIWASMAQRLAVLVLTPIVLLAAPSLVPRETLWRMVSFSARQQMPSANVRMPSAGTEAVSTEALESSKSREYLLQTSIRYTLQRPLTGLGPGQFLEYEGSHNEVLGTHGIYHDTHNTFTQVSSETGIPGLLIFVAGVGSILNVFRKVHRQARSRPECRDIRTAAFCLMLGMLGFCTAITFLSFAYFFYFPAMGGLAICVARAARVEFETRKTAVSCSAAGYR